MNLPALELCKLSWEDASFHGFTWENEGRDLRLDLAHASLPISSLLCTWASDLRVDLTWVRPPTSTAEAPLRHGGPLLTRDGRLAGSPDGRWSVWLDFGGHGELRLECENVTST